ncbi:hypothetical protein GHI93_02755 [Lactococcus hircilactis]|uniref:Uncharacterized protein n=1 Tax=Lactococcus hircilactis TaxID=1494462 RepID=A0A7X1Z704_9LACT|nr:hypothetical protein [Lactococcus hircilactis]MQW38870.1 hypothetical protein [Lactococcus hircilactis]
MGKTMVCDCEERRGVKIDSERNFLEYKSFFEKKVRRNLFKDVEVKLPYHIYIGENEIEEWFSDKWFLCKECGQIWEFDAPDFPALGWIRKITKEDLKNRRLEKEKGEKIALNLNLKITHFENLKFWNW